jgi:hypothetical protein
VSSALFNNTKELTKTKQLLRKMTSGNAAIAALNDSMGTGLQGCNHSGCPKTKMIIFDP